MQKSGNSGEEEETESNSKYGFVYNKLVKDRVIFLSEDIEAENASAIVAMMLLLNSQDKKKPITLFINSSGGYVEPSFAIYDTMNMIEAPVKTVCCGGASSFAAILLAAGTKGMRFATPSSRIMIHQIQLHGGSVATRGTDVEIEAKEVKAIKIKMTEVLARHTGQTYRKVYRDCEVDKYMTVEEAKSYGIIDGILKPLKKIPKLKTGKTSA